jgi:hypothetical protein
LSFYAWGDNGGYVPFALPAIGHSVAIPKVDLSKMVKRALSGK